MYEELWLEQQKINIIRRQYRDGQKSQSDGVESVTQENGNILITKNMTLISMQMLCS
jgi:hypothetical protein